MTMDYRNDRNRSIGQKENQPGSEQTKSNHSRMSTGVSWGSPTERQSGYSYYGRDNASMRGNDYYGSQGFGNDYSRKNYSASTFGQKSTPAPASSPKHSSRERAYGEGAPYGHSSYGQEGSREYTDFMEHNYGYRSPAEKDRFTKGYDNSLGGYGASGYGSTSYNNRDQDRERRVRGNAGKPGRSGSRASQKYSENDGRRR